MATSAQIAKLFEEFGLDDGMKGFQNGGILNTFLLTFRLPQTAHNNKFLEETFGAKYSSMFLTADFNDEGVNTDDPDIAEYTITIEPTISFNDPVEYTYRYYIFDRNSLVTMPNERLAQLAPQCISVIQSIDNPCPHDQFILVLVQLILAAVTIYTGGLTGWASAAVVVSSAISIGQTLGAFSSDPDTQKALVGVQVALALVGGYSAFVNNGALASIGATMNFALTIANSCISIYSTYSSISYQAAIKAETEEQERLQEEMGAVTFEQKLRYTFGDSYDSTYREGHEADPYAYVNDIYKDFT